MGISYARRKAAPGLLLWAFIGLSWGCTFATAGAPSNFSVHIPSWKFYTAGDISGGAVGDMSLATGPNAAAFIVYQDWGPAKATARQLIGNVWTLLGSAGFSAGTINTPSAAYDSAGTPYVVYNDSVATAATLKKFNGSAWVSVGGSGFTPDVALDTSLAIGPGDVPYVAFSDKGASTQWAATVMYHAGSWLFLGPEGFSGVLGGVSSTSIAFDTFGTPYVGYVDGNTGNNVTVMMYNGSTWVPVGGTAGFGPSTGLGNTSLAISPTTQDPWLAFSEPPGTQATVMKYHGGVWTFVGSRRFTAGVVTGLTLKFDSKGNPYVACSDAGLGSRAVVYTFDGTSWRLVGNGVSARNVGTMAFSVDSKDTPVCVYRDDAGFSHAFVASFH